MKTLLPSILILRCATALAQDGNVIPFQGQLADQSGQALTPASPVTIVFRLYQTPVGGVAIWEEAQPNISVTAGRFSILLGSRTALPAYTNFNATLYLGLTVDDGDPQTTDVEMRPRQALVPVISTTYAKQAQNADKLGGFDWSALFGANNPQGSILGSRISPGTVTSNQIAPQTIAAAQIAASTLTAAQIAPATITSNQIAPGTIDVVNLAHQVLNKLVPVGTVVPFAGDQNRVSTLESSGWLLCDGRRVLKNDYPELWLMISDHWGQAGGETFVLPDLRGVFLRGVDNSPNADAPGGAITGRDPDGGTRSYWGGTGGRQVGTIQSDAFFRHKHKDSDRSPEPPEGFEVWEPELGTRYSPFDATGTADSGQRNYTSEEGGSETRPKNVYVNYIIKY